MKTQNAKENQRTPTNTFGKTNKNKVLKGFTPTLGYVFSLFFGFPERVLENKKTTFGKTKHTKEHQRQPKEPSGKPTKTKFLKVSDPPLDMYFFWFSRTFLENKKQPSGKPKTNKPKNLRENQTNKTEKTYPRVDMKPLKTLFIVCFP